MLIESHLKTCYREFLRLNHNRLTADTVSIHYNFRIFVLRDNIAFGWVSNVNCITSKFCWQILVCEAIAVNTRVDVWTSVPTCDHRLEYKSTYICPFLVIAIQSLDQSCRYIFIILKLYRRCWHSNIYIYTNPFRMLCCNHHQWLT